VSRVSGAHLRGFAPAWAYTSRLQQWRIVGNVWEICSAQDLNPVLPALEADVLSLESSGRFYMFITLLII